jgi:hypothetical protein
MSSMIQDFTRSLLPPREDLEWIREWFWDRGCWFTISGMSHAILILVIALIPFSHRAVDQPPTFTSTTDTTIGSDLEHMEMADVDISPLENTEDLGEPAAQTAQYYDDSPEFEEQGGGVQVANAAHLGGLGGVTLNIDGPGPKMQGGGGIGGSDEPGTHAGLGGTGEGFGGRGQGHRDEILAAQGGTKAGERAVTAALIWLRRHQSNDGSWSLNNYTQRCKGPVCSGVGVIHSDAAGTALGLLPFLAADHTHKKPGPHQATVRKGIQWLIHSQKADGDLSGGGEQMMYAHGLATITLCEAYGLTHDRQVGAAAQKAVNFIIAAQSQSSGGWRYRPQADPGDTSVFGWQIMALKSAQMAGLAVDTQCLERAKKFLQSVSKGEHGGKLCYLPFDQPTPPMSAVGLLCKQYLGAPVDDPAMLEGKKYLLANPPDGNFLRNTYYWYYATQVMHNFLDSDWDTWNRKMRRILIESQARDGCAMGSWDPENPSPDMWPQGGRVMITSLSALTLEVYYRYLPLYRIDGSSSPHGSKAPAGGETDEAEPAEQPSGKLTLQ